MSSYVENEIKLNNIKKDYRNEQGMGQSRQRLETDFGKIWRVE